MENGAFAPLEASKGVIYGVKVYYKITCGQQYDVDDVEYTATRDVREDLRIAPSP